jgi:hypothetical protein
MRDLKLVELPSEVGLKMVLPMVDVVSTLDWSEPPKDLSGPLQALWWLKKGGLVVGPEWEKAHALVQTAEGVAAFDWIHALMHWIEADMGNADYWYRRAGRKRSKPSVSAEWQFMVDELSQGSKPQA